MIIICLFTFLFYPPCNINRALDKSRDFVNMCYVMCSCVLCRWLAVGSTHDPIMCVCVAYREEPICFSHVYLSKRERERKGFEPNTNAVSYFGLLLHIPRQPRSLPCLTRWQMGEREREKLESYSFICDSTIRPIYVCTGAVDRRQKTFNHRFFSPAGAGLYFILCFCTIKKKKEKKKLLALCGNEASFSGLKSQSIKPIRIEYNKADVMSWVIQRGVKHL